MKQFFGAFFGSIIGFFITGIVSALIIGAMIAGGIKSAFNNERGTYFSVKENSVLHIKLEGEIKERGRENPFEELNFGAFMPPAAIGIRNFTEAIKKAKTDDHIKGIYLDIKHIAAGFATLEELRNALLDFKTSGKFIYAYSEVYSQKTYYLATSANKIFMNPQGGMEFKGLSSQIMFFKNTLEKLNIEMQIFRHGKFKSAIEPFMLDKMSEANRLQIETYINSIWGTMLDGISKQRKISVDELNAMCNTLAINSPEEALKNKLVDELLYEDEVMKVLKKDLKLEEKDKIAFAELGKYSKSSHKASRKENRKFSKKPKIAIVYAVGQIISGKGDEETVGSDDVAEALKDARLDTNVKAIVLRVNSPGGSALASDVIWREMTLCKKAKPTIVSMGDVAASGGYYISCAADRIFAQPNTITGSIGVFGILPNMQKMFSEKFGINIDTVNTNKHSDVGSPFRAVTADEQIYIQNGVEKVYDTFISRVAEGRNTTKDMIDSIGQGRVWSGVDAIKINLVDELGGLEKAIAYAAKKAKVEDYKIEELPKVKDPFAMFLDKGQEDMETRLMAKNLGEQYKYLKFVKNLVNQKGIQARIPYDMIIE